MKRQPRVTIATHQDKAYAMQPLSLSPVGASTPGVTGSAVWVKGAELNADSWRVGADQFSILLTAEGSTAPAMDYWQGIGHRQRVSEVSLYPRGGRLSAAANGGYNAYDFEYSRPKVPTVGDVLGCVISDARTYLDCRDSESPVDGLISEGLINPHAPDFSVRGALDTWESLRAQFHRWRVLEDATGVTLDAAAELLESEGLL